MTLGVDSRVPDPPQDLEKNPQTATKYLRELGTEFKKAYREIAENSNGDTLWNYGNNERKWEPEVFGVSTAGEGTYSADKQIGWAFRQGLMTDIWFDITWTGHTGSGNMYVQLPYTVAKSNEKPFVGTIQASSIAFAGSATYLVLNAIPDTLRAEVWSCTTSAATANIALPTTGHIIGHVRYIGKRQD